MQRNLSVKGILDNIKCSVLAVFVPDDEEWGGFDFFFFWSGGKPILFNLYSGSLKHQMAYSVFPVLSSFSKRIRKTGLLSCGVVSRTLNLLEFRYQEVAFKIIAKDDLIFVI